MTQYTQARTPVGGRPYHTCDGESSSNYIERLFFPLWCGVYVTLAHKPLIISVCYEDCICVSVNNRIGPMLLIVDIRSDLWFARRVAPACSYPFAYGVDST